MALAVLETEEGRAMLLNAAMRQADLGRHLFHSEWLSILSEPWPHYVHYRGGLVIYCAPDSIFPWGPSGPSDSVWFVPGTC